MNYERIIFSVCLLNAHWFSNTFSGVPSYAAPLPDRHQVYCVHEMLIQTLTDARVRINTYFQCSDLKDPKYL